MNTKYYTSIEMSKKLMELGLNPETADMFYFLDPTPAGNIYHLVVPRIGFGVRTREPEYNKGDVPCWSVGALLKLMPDRTSIFCRYNYTTIDMVDVNNGIVRDKHREEGPTPLEALYSMIVWLLENGYIKTEKK